MGLATTYHGHAWILILLFSISPILYSSIILSTGYPATCVLRLYIIWHTIASEISLEDYHMYYVMIITTASVVP